MESRAARQYVLLVLMAGILPTASAALPSASTADRPHNNKFVVYKGREGFGDRLQQLLYAIQYAKATGRIMVPEWSDKRWANHDQSNFEDYLGLDGLRTMRWQPEFLTMWRMRRESLSVVPNAWHFLFERPVSAADLDSPRFLLAKNNAILQVCKHAQQHRQTVDNNIVYGRISSTDT